MNVTHAAGQKAIIVVFVDDGRLGWSGDSICTFFDYHFDRVFGAPDEQSVLETMGNYIGIDVVADEDSMTLTCDKTRANLKGLMEANGLELLDVKKISVGR